MKAFEISGGTHMYVETFTMGTRLQTRQIVVFKTRDRYDLRRKVDVGIPRGVQWWDLGTTLHQCKVVDLEPSLLSLPKGTHVATTFALNNFYIARMRFLQRATTLPTTDMFRHDEEQPPEHHRNGTNRGAPTNKNRPLKGASMVDMNAG